VKAHIYRVAHDTWRRRGRRRRRRRRRFNVGLVLVHNDPPAGFRCGGFRERGTRRQRHGERGGHGRGPRALDPRAIQRPTGGAVAVVG
jgi:hypothetical protein